MWTAKSLKKYWPERESLLLALLTLLVFLWMEEHWPRVHSPLVQEQELTCRALEPLVHRLEQVHVVSQDSHLKEERFSRLRMAKEIRRQLLDRLDKGREVLLHSEVDVFLNETKVSDIQVAAEIFLEGDCRRLVKMWETYRAGLDRLNELSPLNVAPIGIGQRLQDIERRLKMLLEPARSAELEDFFQSWPESIEDLQEKSRWRLALRFRDLELLEPKRPKPEVLELALRSLNRDRQPGQFTQEKQIPSIAFGIIVSSIDAHTRYYSESDFQRFWKDHQSSFGGLGIQIREDLGGIRVVNLVPGGPAEKQGILRGELGKGSGDLITRVLARETIEETKNSTGKSQTARIWQNLNLSLEGVDSQRAAEWLMGPVGTRVILEVSRQGAPAPIVVTLERGVVPTKRESIKSQLISWPTTGQKFGYIKMDRFYGGSLVRDFAQTVNQLVQKGLSGLLLDLRDNPGGDLAGALQVASLFLGSRPLVLDIDGMDRSIRAHWGEGPEQITGPLVVLVNENSASAAEILAGSLQTYHRAVIVGSQHTFGKGSIQAVTSLKQLFNLDGFLGGIKYTSSYYFLPDGTPIHGRGVIPDILANNRTLEECVAQKDLENALPTPRPLDLPGVDIKALAAINQDAFRSFIGDVTRELKLKSIAQNPGLKCLPKELAERERISSSEKTRALRVLSRLSRWWEKRNTVAERSRAQTSRKGMTN